MLAKSSSITHIFLLSGEDDDDSHRLESNSERDDRVHWRQGLLYTLTGEDTLGGEGCRVVRACLLASSFCSSSTRRCSCAFSTSSSRFRRWSGSWGERTAHKTQIAQSRTTYKIITWRRTTCKTQTALRKITYKTQITWRRATYKTQITWRRTTHKDHWEKKKKLRSHNEEPNTKLRSHKEEPNMKLRLHGEEPHAKLGSQGE